MKRKTSTPAKKPVPKTSKLANWYGTDTLVVDLAAAILSGCEHVAIPAAGGMGIVARLDARLVLVNDLHRHVINLARVAADERLGPELEAKVAALPLHPDVLAAAQARCRQREETRDHSVSLFQRGGQPLPSWTERPDLTWAVDYFTCTWMGHGGRSGTDGEFDGGLSYRWNAGGGGSAVRFGSAVASLIPWHALLGNGRCEFSTFDGIDFLRKVKDRPGHGVYVDWPWPDAGDGYKHKFTTDQQRDAAAAAARFKHSRVVVRYGDHPLIRELYPSVERGGPWTYVRQQGRNQANNAVDEVLILNGAAAAARSEAA